MPIGSFTGLNTSLRALLAQQAALDVTGHNIANVETKGYTRQTAQLSATAPLLVGAGATQDGAGAQLGQGVDVLSYQRSRDQFGDLQFRAQTMASGASDTTAQALGYAEDLLAEPGDGGLNATLSGFYDAWATLGANPTSAAAAQGVASAGTAVATRLGTLQGGIDALRTSASTQLDQLRGATGPIKQISDELGSLDSSIRRATQAGQQPNDLLDRRDVLLDQLSSYGQVTTLGDGTGSLDVQLDGAAVVTGGTSAWNGTGTPTNGRLGALATLASASGPLGQWSAALDGLAGQLASTVDAVSPGFFSGSTASTLRVSGTPRAGTSGAGDGSGAQAVAAGRAAPGGVPAAYASLVASIGSATASAKSQSSVAATLAGAADDRRQSVNGVSLDEEMINLTRFQRGYQAASRAFSTMDEALDVLINRTGRVGL